MAHGKLQSALSAGNDGGEHFEGGVGCLGGASFSGRVDHAIVFTLRKCETADIAAKKSDSRV